jgi:diguanylate cyclase (GGDEF)-like protein/PAS domain S-box-containing protein
MTPSVPRVALRRDRSGRSRLGEDPAPRAVAPMSGPPDLAHSSDSVALSSEPVPAVPTHVWGIVGVGDAAGLVQWVSPSVEAFLGYGSDELIGRCGAELVHADDRAEIEAAYTALIEPGASSRAFRLRVRDPGGAWRHVEVVLTNLRDTPAVGGVVINARDLGPGLDGATTGANPPPFRELADNAAVMMWIADADDRVVFFNRRWYEFTGRRPEDELGVGWEAGLHPDDRERVRLALRARNRGGEPTEVDYRIRVGDGSYRRVVSVGVPRYAPDGTFTGHVGTVVDVTDRVEPQAAQARSESRFRALVEHAHDLVSIYDDHGRFAFASPSHRATLGYEPDELIGRSALDLLHPDEREDVAQAFVKQLLVTGIPAPIEHRVRHRDGSWRWIESVATMLVDDPAIGGVLVNARDVTDRRRAELIAADQARILEAVARGAPLASTLDAVARLVETWIVDACAVVTINEAERRVLHIAAAPNLPAPCVAALEEFAIDPATQTIPDTVVRHQLVDAGDLGPAHTLLEHGYQSWWGMPIRDAGGGAHFGAVLVMRANGGEPQPRDKRILEVAASLAAIAVERARTQARLSHQALHDALTGLPNRDQVIERLRRIGRHERHGGPDVAVLFLDLDRFKVLNDSVGHDAGDRLLVSMGQRLHAALRPGDLIARFGGDEFVVVCEHLDGIDDALALADRLLSVAREPFNLDGLEVVVTVSIGMAVADGRPPEALLRDADAAMYRAKEKGRDRAEIFDAQLREDVVARLDTERQLRHALDHGGLIVHYQPVVSLRTGALAGFEALLRWQHPQKGLLSPPDFLEIAEDSGLMRPIGGWVRSEVCRTVARWHHEHPEWGRFVTSINISAAELSDPHLATNIAKLVLDSDIEPALLSFEMTERLALQDAEAARELFAELRELGVMLALDDFGTGYSPLLHLKEFPIEAVKVDRGFVSGLGVDPFDDAIVDAVVDLAHHLELSSIALGVETAAQAEHLRRVGCMQAQGHWFAVPMPGPLAEAWATRRAALPQI